MKDDNTQFWGVVWSLLDKIGAQIVAFIIGVILARLLEPLDYGLIGVLSIFIAMSNVLIEGGFSNALIRKLDRTEWDLSTAFYFNVVLGIVLYLFLFIIAPYVSVFFNEPTLTSLLRIIGLNVLFNSLCIVQNAILTAQLNIRIQTFISLGAQIPIGIIAIFLAYKGFGVYALAFQSVGFTVIKTFLYWLFTNWKPVTGFSRNSFNYLFTYGSKLVGANLIGAVFNELYSVVIGKYIGKQDLGFYTKAKSLASQPDTVCAGVVQKVTIPVFADVQNDKSLLLSMYRRYVRSVMCLMAPISFFLIFNARPIVLFLWTEKWSDSIILFQLLAFAGLWSPISYLNLSLLQVINRTDFLLKLEFIKKPISLIIIVISIRWGILGVVIGQVLIAIIADGINLVASKSFIKYSYYEQFDDVFRYIIYAIVSGTISFILMKDELNLALHLFVFFILFFLIYMSFLVLFRDIVFVRCFSFLKTKL